MKKKVKCNEPIVKYILFVINYKYPFRGRERKPAGLAKMAELSRMIPSICSAFFIESTCWVFDNWEGGIHAIVAY